MEKTEENGVQNDPLGLNQFALTESAYDLLNSLKGVYSRLIYSEGKNGIPNQDLINYWRGRSQEWGRQYRQLDWTDSTAVELFIANATAEWQQAEKIASDRLSAVSYAH